MHNSIYKQDFICLSETYLDSPSSDSLLELEGYNLVCTVHPNNIKRDWSCLYFMEPLPVQIINLHYFKETLFLEISIVTSIKM